MSEDDQEVRARARIGSVLSDKWTLETLIGVGGMAAVYAARHRNGARAAVKVLHPELARHADVCERFRREGYAANRVEHPGVVKVLDDDVVASGPDEGSPYLVMELLEGESLQERLERGPAIGEREFLVMAEAILDVLEAAHARGVVHRDIKPENLFLVRDDRATDGVRIKVLDFGLARLLQAQSITTHGLALGTPSFMSPEQAGGRGGEIDGRTDLFSLAATGFRLITGLRIHEADGAVELVMKMAKLPAPPIRSVAPHVSEPFARVIDRALAFQRDDRYASATLMRADVKKAIAEIDDAARAAIPELSSSNLEPVLPPLPPLPPPRRPPRRRGCFVFVALGALVVGAVGAKLALDPNARARLFATTSDTPTAASTAAATTTPSSAIVATTDAADLVAPLDDAATADALATDLADASTDATTQDAADASDGSDDDDDDDDDDASTDAAATPDAVATRTTDASPAPPVKKRPRPPKKKPTTRPPPRKRPSP